MTSRSNQATVYPRALQDVLTSEELSAEDRCRVRLLLGRLLSVMDEHDAAFAEYGTAVTDFADRPALAAPAMMRLAWPVVTDHTSDWHQAWLERATALLPYIELPAERLWCTANRAAILALLGDEPAGRWRMIFRGRGCVDDA